MKCDTLFLSCVNCGPEVVGGGHFLGWVVPSFCSPRILNAGCDFVGFVTYPLRHQGHVLCLLDPVEYLELYSTHMGEIMLYEWDEQKTDLLDRLYRIVKTAEKATSHDKPPIL